MTRPIQFRFWDSTLKRWVQPAALELAADGSIHVIRWGNKNLTTDRIIPSQYVGLTDINGRPIFEGDILAQMSHGENIRLRPNYLKVVQWNIAGFNIQSSNFEVVGNIFENPDLLKPAD